MLGKEYYREPSNDRIRYEIITNPKRLCLVKGWKHNRPPDTLRVEEIVTHLKHTNTSDGQILLSVINGECVCYDGLHRLEAVKKYFPTGGIQARIMYDSTDEETRQEFTRINRGIPVPDLYFSYDEISSHITKILQKFTKGFIQNYKIYLSSSRKPRKPNFNRDIFTDDIGSLIKEIYSDEDIMKINEDTIAELLRKTNDIIRKQHHDNTHRLKISKKAIEKCEKHKMFIFSRDWKPVFKSFVPEK